LSVSDWSTALAATAELLKRTKARGVIVGGVAVSLTVEARFTKDVDALLLDEHLDIPALIETAKEVGLTPKPSDPLEFAHRYRVLPLLHEDSGFGVDIVLASLPFEKEAIDRAGLVRVEDRPIPIATPEDLIIMKAVAGRPQDWADVSAIVAGTEALDEGRIRQWVAEFAALLDRPQLVSELDQALFG
jgi:hypothetical protein